MQVLSQDSQADLMTYRLRELYNGVPLGGGEEASDDESYEMSSMLSAHLRTPGVEFEMVWMRLAEGGPPMRAQYCQYNMRWTGPPSPSLLPFPSPPRLPSRPLPQPYLTKPSLTPPPFPLPGSPAGLSPSPASPSLP